MIRATALSAGIVGLVAAGPAQSDGFRLRSEFGLSTAGADATSVATGLGYRRANAAGLGLRLMWDGSAGPFRFEVHADLNAASGSRVGLAQAMMAAAAPPPTLFDLSGTWSAGRDTLILGTIDRASVSYTTGNLVLKAGRQAITWGGGLSFHPSDIVAPFPPDAIDTSYKPGVDMLYVQYLFDNGANIQAIAVPRAATVGGPVTLDQSTIAIRASASAGGLDGALFAARDRGDSVAGLNLSGPLGGASWNAEHVYWQLADGTSYPSWLFNISNYGTLGDWNVAYFAEYYHNGFGVSSSTPVDALPASLTKRISTGQAFLGGRDFLALGGQVQMTADLSISPSVIVSLNDGSALAAVGVTYSLGDNTDLSLNLFQPVGSDGTEFGGRETSAGSGTFAGPAKSATLRIVHFF